MFFVFVIDKVFSENWFTSNELKFQGQDNRVKTIRFFLIIIKSAQWYS